MLIRAFAAGCALVVATALPASAAGADKARPYVVVYDTPPRAAFPVQAETSARERAYGFRSDHRFRHAIDGFAAHLTGDQVRALRADPDIALVGADRTLRAARVPLTGGEAVPTGVARIGAAGPAGVHPASSAAVAVLDTGLDLGHPELNVRSGPNCAGTGSPRDDDGHGTHVAGVIGARNHGSGVVGVAPGTELYAVKVLNSTGVGLVSEIVCGIDWVTAYGRELGIRVVNMSLSGGYSAGSCQDDPLHLAICRSVGAGFVYTVAAGNSGVDLALEIPASYTEVLTVTAMSDTDGAPGGSGAPSCEPRESDDRFATFSNFAVRPADVAHVIAAPGVCIESTARGGGHAIGKGTSVATPHVAGVIALCMGEPGRPGPCADMSPVEVIDQLRTDAAANATPANGFLGDPFTPVGKYFGHLVSAADPSVRRIAPRPAPVPAALAPPPVDKTLELLALRIRRRQDVDSLSVVVRVAEAATVRADARVRLRGSPTRLIVGPRTMGQAEPDKRLRLKVRLPAVGVQQIKRALRRRVRVRARVTVTVTDVAGNARTRSRRVRLSL